MNGQTLADVFGGPELTGATGKFFSLEDMQKTASMTAAETVDNAGSLVNSLVATATDRLLDIPVSDIMMGAWVKMSDIQEFAIGEKLLSRKTHKYPLTEHKITSKHKPKMELFVHNTKITEVILDITLTLVIAKTKLMIKKGRIMEVRISGCQAMGKVSCYGQTIVEKKSDELKLPSTIKLGKGIEIPPPLKLKMA